MSYEFSKEQMDKLLISYGWKKIEGYAMGYSAPESENIIVTVEEIKKFVCSKPNSYYWEEGNEECTTDIESAFESLFESVWEENDLDIEDDVDKWLLKDLEKLNKEGVKK